MRLAGRSGDEAGHKLRQIISIQINVTTPLPRLRRTLSHGGEREEYIFALSPCGRGWRVSAGRGGSRRGFAGMTAMGP